MARGTISERVERLELTVQGLETLPGEVAGLRQDVTSLGERVTGVESQMLQLRTEMHAEFSAVRGELGAMRGELADKIDENWHRTRALHEHLIEQIKTIGEQAESNPSRREPRSPRRKL
jgi:hypothetical protein